MFLLLRCVLCLSVWVQLNLCCLSAASSFVLSSQPPVFSTVAPAWGSERLKGGVNVVVAVLRIAIRAQWSGDLWVWVHPPRPVADPQRCGTQGGKITALLASVLPEHLCP